MIDPTPEMPETAIEAGLYFHLEAHALARLESLAKAKDISTTVALHQLLEAGTRHLTVGDAPSTRSLTKKQAAVLKSLKAGLSVKEIAAQFGVSEGTIRTHIHRMRCHLNCSDLLSLRYQ
jgi:DNA-binding NarL/FixJ family response regulator